MGLPLVFGTPENQSIPLPSVAAKVNMAGADSIAWLNPLRGGMFGIDTALELRQVTDGLSKTMMLAELRIGFADDDPRGVWAYGHAGGNLLAGHGSDGDANGPNPCNDKSDDVWGPTAQYCTESVFLQQACMTCFRAGGHTQGATRSNHPGGIQAASGDGSVQWIGNDIETSGSGNGLRGPCCSPWDHILARGDGEDGSTYLRDKLRRQGAGS